MPPFFSVYMSVFITTVSIPPSGSNSCPEKENKERARRGHYQGAEECHLGKDPPEALAARQRHVDDVKVVGEEHLIGERQQAYVVSKLKVVRAAAVRHHRRRAAVAILRAVAGNGGSGGDGSGGGGGGGGGRGGCARDM